MGTRLVIAGASSALISSAAAQFAGPVMKPVGYDVADTAAIVVDPTTVGFADPGLYGLSSADINKNLDLLQSTGATTVRILIPWAGVEPLPNTYDWSTVDAVVNAAAARGMAIDGVLNSTPFYATAPGTPPISGAPANPAQYATFASQVAARYAGKVSAYEIYNEPNSVQYFQATDPAAAYTALLKAAYPAIKAADPTATVVGGVLGSVTDFGNLTINPVTFLSNVYKDGGAGYFDALSFHPYQYTTLFSQGASLPNSPLNQLTALRQLMIANGDAAKLIWATEYGLPTSVVSPQTQASFIGDFLNSYSHLSYAGPSFIYTVQDTTNLNDPNNTFGVFNPDGTPKPAEQVIQQFIAAHTPITAPPPPPNPGAVFAAQVAAFYQQVIRAYLSALANALASWGHPAATAAPQVLSATTTASQSIDNAATAATAAPQVLSTAPTASGSLGTAGSTATATVGTTAPPPLHSTSADSTPAAAAVAGAVHTAPSTAPSSATADFPAGHLTAPNQTHTPTEASASGATPTTAHPTTSTPTTTSTSTPTTTSTATQPAHGATPSADPGIHSTNTGPITSGTSPITTAATARTGTASKDVATSPKTIGATTVRAAVAAADTAKTVTGHPTQPAEHAPSS